jgi:outer membrane protein OmpA-like peptidoglycan-associated protein
MTAALFLSFPAGAEEFVWKHAAGDQYRIISTVHEDVYVNDAYSHHAEILNRISVTVESVEGEQARHRGVFMTAEEALFGGPESGAGGTPGEGDAPAGVFSWSEEYVSVFERDRRGAVTIGEEYFMPVVRNVPVFPEGDLKPGDTWSAEGHESHDFRESFGIAAPYRIPFTAHYRYLGMREWEGREYPAVSVSYQVDHAVGNRVPSSGPLDPPRRIRGNSEEIIYWDGELGQARHYTEEFSISIELADGNVVTFSGTAEAELVESALMDRERMAEEIAGELSGLGVEDAEVRVSEEGVTIVLEDIQFTPESAALLPSEREKLDRIAEVLRRHRDRDILVAGHTALAGSAAGREQLSRERAGAVAEYLIAGRVRPRDRVFIRGYGASRPLAGNATEQDRRRNRRVEIILLEN